jgi:hypothetical protein
LVDRIPAPRIKIGHWWNQKCIVILKEVKIDKDLIFLDRNDRINEERRGAKAAKPLIKNRKTR